MLEKIKKDDGFLKNHHTKLLNSLSPEDLQRFSLLGSDEERFSFVYKLPIVQELEVQTSESGKNGDAASKLKELGNKAFQSGDYRSSLQLYNKSILKTPWAKESSRDIAIMLANRSAALYHLEKHLASLQDIELVLTLDYPQELRYKVLERKARSLLALKQLRDALYTFRSTLTAIDSAKLNSERKIKLQTDVQIMIAMLSKNDTMIKGGLINEPLPTDALLTPQPIESRNPQYPAASSSVIVNQTPEMGRYAEANVDVRVGDTLVIEKPHCSVLLEEYCATHCFQCFKRLLAPVPCNYCSAVAFCSVKCRDDAMVTHHRVECKILPALWNSGASITCYMALRILSQREMKFFLERKQHLEQGEEVTLKKYSGSDYLTVYNLVRNEIMRTPEDYLQRTGMAAFLLQCLKLGGFFEGTRESSATEVLSADEAFVGGLLLRHLQILQFNAHEISELQLEKDGKLENAKSVFLGGGLYPTLALFNHSCDPGVTRYFCGTSVVVRAIKNIGKNEMIGENYGPIFTQSPRIERCLNLKNQYWFTCACRACVEDWPRFKDMDPGTMRFRCDAGGSNQCSNIILVPTTTDDFMVPCQVCKQHTNILKGLKALQDTDALFKLATRHMAVNEIIPALTKFIAILSLLSETLAPPFRDFHLCQQGIRRCMLALGNKS